MQTAALAAAILPALVFIAIVIRKSEKEVEGFQLVNPSREEQPDKPSTACADGEASLDLPDLLIPCDEPGT